MINASKPQTFACSTKADDQRLLIVLASGTIMLATIRVETRQSLIACKKLKEHFLCDFLTVVV
jgi:hypothetical protein